MDCIEAPIENLSQYYSNTVFDYLKRDQKLAPFYQNYPDIEGYADTIKSKTFTSEARAVLHQSLKQQYGDILNQPGSELVAGNIDLLLQPNTFTVTTGQQIHIYLGPLYVTYKILSTIAKCQWLAKNFEGYNFVPVFWMATEDHDFEEISHLKLFSKEFFWPQTEGYTGAVGRINPASINHLESEIAQVIANDEDAKKLVALFTDAYKNFPTLADATRQVVHTLFGDKGLVVIDADDKELKQQFVPYIKQDIFTNKNLEAATNTTAKLEENYKTQVSARPINFFYLTDNSRKRLVQEGNIYKVLDTDIEFTQAQLEADIDNHPQKFSPNVILRPLYQEVILPNLAYVGGPAEVNYWLQLKDVFVANDVPFPIIELRKSVIIVNEKSTENIRSIGFEPLDFLMPEKELAESYIQSSDADKGLELTAYYQAIETKLEEIKTLALAADASLKPFLEGEFKKITETFGKLDGKLEKTHKQKFEKQLKLIETIKARFFTPGKLAEREETLLTQPQIVEKEASNKILSTFYQQNSPLIIVLPPLK